MKTASRAAGTNTKLVSIKNHHYVYVIIDEWMISSYRSAISFHHIFIQKKMALIT
jgi:hypothetical protein